MGQIRILAIEDDPILADTLGLLVEELGYLMIAVVDNSTEALRMFKATLPDLVLMDIQIKGQLNGIEVAQRMMEERPTPIIFITSLRDRDIFEQAKAIGPHAFLNKPFDELSVQNAIELAVSRMIADDKSSPAATWNQEVITGSELFVKVKNRLVKLAFQDVRWAEVEGKYAYIVTNEARLEIRIALKDLEKRLPTGMFIRVHRNYLVNIKQVSSIDLDTHQITVSNQQIPLGSRFRDAVLKSLSTLG